MSPLPSHDPEVLVTDEEATERAYLRELRRNGGLKGAAVKAVGWDRWSLCKHRQEHPSFARDEQLVLDDLQVQREAQRLDRPPRRRRRR